MTSAIPPALGERSLDPASKSEMATMETPHSARARQGRPYKYYIMLLVILISALYYLYWDKLPWHQPYTYQPDVGYNGPHYSDAISLPPPYTGPNQPHDGYDDFDEDNDWVLQSTYSKTYPIKRHSIEERGYISCWQNKGVWIKHLTPVEMAHLGVDRFHHSERSLDQAEEDAFCAKLRLYGASFWLLPPEWPKDVSSHKAPYYRGKPTIRVNFTVCFPESGGVWFLSGNGHTFYTRFQYIYNALTMEERCNVIKDLEGKFCEDIHTCPEMAPLLVPLEIRTNV